MLQTKMSIQKVIKACASFGSTDGGNPLHLCFDNITEYEFVNSLIALHGGEDRGVRRLPEEL